MPDQVKEMDSEVQGIAAMLRNAKTELKKSKRVDYYKLLDISQDASEADIKKVRRTCTLQPNCTTVKLRSLMLMNSRWCTFLVYQEHFNRQPVVLRMSRVRIQLVYK